MHLEQAADICQKHSAYWKLLKEFFQAIFFAHLKKNRHGQQMDAEAFVRKKLKLSTKLTRVERAQILFDIGVEYDGSNTKEKFSEDIAVLPSSWLVQCLKEMQAADFDDEFYNYDHSHFGSLSQVGVQEPDWMQFPR